VFAGPEHAYPSRIISLSILVSIIFVSSVGKSFGLGWAGYAYHRSRRGKPGRGQQMHNCGGTSHSTTHIELVNKCVDAGFVTGQVFGSSHSVQSSLVRSQRLPWSLKVFGDWCTIDHCGKGSGRMKKSTSKQHQSIVVGCFLAFGGTLLAEYGVIEMPNVGLWKCTWLASPVIILFTFVYPFVWPNA